MPGADRAAPFCYSYSLALIRDWCSGKTLRKIQIQGASHFLFCFSDFSVCCAISVFGRFPLVFLWTCLIRKDLPYSDVILHLIKAYQKHAENIPLKRQCFRSKICNQETYRIATNFPNFLMTLMYNLFIYIGSAHPQLQSTCEGKFKICQLRSHTALPWFDIPLVL